jgi:hypothetical protein
MGLVCGFDDFATAPLADVEFVFGMDSNGGSMPSIGQPLGSSASNWFGLYGEGGTIGFGFKPSGTTAITRLDLLSSALYDEYTGFYIFFDVLPGNTAINYSVSTMSAVGVLTPLVSGSTSAYNAGDVAINPIVGSVNKGGVGAVSVFCANITIQNNIIGAASL